jgi:protein-L-isoaspartate(D-aspartate) O-methyltransferase
LRQLGYHNVQVLHENGTLGWPAQAPYDGIVVTAGGPRIPEALREQLGRHGRLVMPVSPQPRLQRLLRVTRVSDTTFCQEDLGAVCFVPLIGAQGWASDQANELAGISDEGSTTLAREEDQ